MSLVSLLLSRDPELVRPIRSALERHSIGVEVCMGPNAGMEILASEHFDAVIVDCDDFEDGSKVLRDLRGTAANKSSVAVAVVNQRTSTVQAFQMGANFVIQKPVSSVNADRCASAAVAMMTRERRRYYRHPLDFGVTAFFGKDEMREAQATNISEGGMAVCFSDPLPSSGLSKISFRLPNMHAPLEFRADLAWADEEGRAGLRFVDLPKKAQETIEDWMTRQVAMSPKPALANSFSAKPLSALAALSVAGKR
jgi:CheY-like chemotaxis protein